jgi:hypothetical protein
MNQLLIPWTSPKPSAPHKRSNSFSYKVLPSLTEFPKFAFTKPEIGSDEENDPPARDNPFDIFSKKILFDSIKTKGQQELFQEIMEKFLRDKPTPPLFFETPGISSIPGTSISPPTHGQSKRLDQTNPSICSITDPSHPSHPPGLTKSHPPGMTPLIFQTCGPVSPTMPLKLKKNSVGKIAPQESEKETAQRLNSKRIRTSIKVGKSGKIKKNVNFEKLNTEYRDREGPNLVKFKKVVNSMVFEDKFMDLVREKLKSELEDVEKLKEVKSIAYFGNMNDRNRLHGCIAHEIMRSKFKNEKYDKFSRLFKISDKYID